MCHNVYAQPELRVILYYHAFLLDVNIMKTAPITKLAIDSIVNVDQFANKILALNELLVAPRTTNQFVYVYQAHREILIQNVLVSIN